MGEIASGKYGKLFLESLKEEIEKMHEMPSVEKEEEYEWFRSSIEWMEKGCQAGEPEIMYLAAEFNYYTKPLCHTVVNLCIPYFEMDESFALYRKAAGKGSEKALLWLAYNKEQGRIPTGMKLDDMELNIKNINRTSENLEFRELDFLKEEFLDLVDEAYDAERIEDYALIDEAYSTPDPGWRSLHIRYVYLAYFMCCLGLEYVTEEIGYEYKWNSPYQKFNQFGKYVKQEKENWRMWLLKMQEKQLQ